MNKEEMLAFARARLKPVTCLDQVEVLACEPGLARIQAPVTTTRKTPSAMHTAAGCIPCATAAVGWPPARAGMLM